MLDLRSIAINDEKRDNRMEEKTYKLMNGAGAVNIAIGVVSIIIGIAVGVLLIISGAKLLTGKTKLIF